MKPLPDHTLMRILHSEEKMEEYLDECGNQPSSIDPIIWQVHLAAPAKKRMPVLERFFQHLLKKYSLVHSFLPDHMVLAKVYTILNVPFNISSPKTSTVDVVSWKKPPKTARFNRLLKLYNSWRKTENLPDLEIYNYREEHSRPFVPYAEFRNECKNKSSNFSAADILSQLSKNKAREKLLANFTSRNTLFSIRGSNQSTDSGIGARDANQCAGKQTRIISKKSDCPKKPTLPKESNFKIFKSRERPRLDVQVKTKPSSASVAHPNAGSKRVPLGSYLKAPTPELCSLSHKSKDETILKLRTNSENRSSSSGSLLIPKPCSVSTSRSEAETDLTGRMDIDSGAKSKDSAGRMDVDNGAKSKDLTGRMDVDDGAKSKNLTGRMDVDDGAKSKDLTGRMDVDSGARSKDLTGRMDVDNGVTSEEVQIEADFMVEEIAVEQDLNNAESSPINLPENHQNRFCSEESASLVQETSVSQIICPSNSPEPEVIYSSSRSEDNVMSLEYSPSHASVLPSMVHQSIPFDEGRKSAAFVDWPKEAVSALSPIRENSSQSLSSCERLSSQQSKDTSDIKDIDDFDQLYKRSPLNIERKKNSTSLQKAKHSERSAFDRLFDEYVDERSEICQINAEEEKNAVSDSESGTVSSRASPSLVYSFIFERRSSESEWEEIEENNFPPVPSPTVVQRDEPADFSPRRLASDIVYTSQEKSYSQSVNSTPELGASKDSASRRMSLSQSTNFSPEPDAVCTSSKKLPSLSRNTTPKRLVPELNASQETPHLQSRKSSPLQSKIVVPASLENPCSQSKHVSPEKPASFVSATGGSSRCQSKNSTPEQPVPKLTRPSQKIPRSQSDQSTLELFLSKILPPSPENSRPQSKRSTPAKPASKIVAATRGNSLSQSKNLSPKQPVPEPIHASQEMPRSQSKQSTLKVFSSKILPASPENPRPQSKRSTPDKSASRIVSATRGNSGFQSESSTPKQPIHASQEILRLQSKQATPEQFLSKILSASAETPRPQSKRSTPEKLPSRIVSAIQRNSGSRSKNSTPEQPVSEIVSRTNENSYSPSRSTAERPVSEVVPSQEESRFQSEKPSKKKISLSSSKVGKRSQAGTNKKQVKKLTDFVAFSVRKRQALDLELGESSDQIAGLRPTDLPVSPESTSSTSIWSPQSQSVGSRKIRKVKKLFSPGENYLLPSPIEEEPPAVNSPDSRTRESPSSAKHNDCSNVANGSDSNLSPKLPTAASYQSRVAKKLLTVSEASLQPSPTEEKTSEVDMDRTTCEPFSFSAHTDGLEVGSSDSDSSCIVLSKEFKTLSLASKKSSVLFASQSSKMSSSSTRSLNVGNSQASTVSNSQFSTEITLDQVDKMMEGVIPKESADSSFTFDFPSQFKFKESPHSEEFDASNFSDISPGGALERTLLADFPDKYSVASSDEEARLQHQPLKFSSQDTTYSASRSTFDGNFSSLYSMEVAPDEDLLDEFSDGNVPSFSRGKSSVTKKKSKVVLSPNFNDGQARSHCLSLPTASKLSRQKKNSRKRQVDVDADDTSDEDVFRARSLKSQPTQLKRKSTSLSAQKLKQKYSRNKENRIGEKKSLSGKKVLKDLQSPRSVAARQFSSRKKKSPISSQKLNSCATISDDDYESDELNSALNDSLTQFNKWKTNEDVPESDAESTTSQYFDDDIAKLLSEYAALNAQQQPLSSSSKLSNSQSTTFMSTKSNSPNSNTRSRASSRKSVTSGSFNYKDIMWNSYPDSLETALTTPEEKLEEVRNNLRERVNNSNSQKLFSSSQKSKSSRENESDSFGFLDWE